MSLVPSSGSPLAMQVPSELSTSAPTAKDDSVIQTPDLKPQIEEAQADGHTDPDPSIGSSTTMSSIPSTGSPSAMQVPSELPTSAPAAKDDLATRIPKLKPKIEEKETAVERNKKYIELGDVIIQRLEILSELVKSSHENDKAIVELYHDMIETYEIALDRNALEVQGVFSKIFDEIVQVSQDCETFLSGCLSRGRLSKSSLAVKGCNPYATISETLINPQTSKITEFKDTFSQLRGKFNNFQLKVTTVTVLKTQKVLDSMGKFLALSADPYTKWASSALNNRLESLKPKKDILPPKSRCSPGTRRKSLAKILDWIFHEDQSVLWISGIAGCGKSSLIGTLHRALATWGNNSPLAAFIRFDRSTYNTASEFIKALAFRLAKFDSRFGEKIAQAIERSPSIIDTPDLEDQAQELIIKPLEDSEIASEGRIVVLVDGIDECSCPGSNETDFRKQLLWLFERNIFGVLPFLRFALASRSEEDIKRLLDQGHGHIHHFPLDHTSFETKTDINYFLTVSFRDQEFDNLDKTRKGSAIEELSKRASGLFIWAATVIGFIKGNVAQRLKLFTENEPPKNALHALTVLYETALNSLVNEQGDDDIKQNICMALGLIMAGSSNNQCTVTRLHGVSNYVDPETNPDILGTFQKLQSLITKEEFQMVIFTERRDKRYQLLHKSFDDFLTSKDWAGHWYIDREKYKAILAEAMITCTMAHLDKADEELPEALSSDLYQYAILGPSLGVLQDLSLYQSLQQKLKRFLLGYVAWKLQHNSEFMRNAWCGASRLQSFAEYNNIYIKDFFNLMLYDAALAGKVTKTNPKDQPESLEWEVDNIYMSVFIQMAGGSKVYEDIVAVLDKNPIPPVVSLGPEMEMPIKIVSGGRIRMRTGFVKEGKEASTKEFIEWGKYKGDEWVPIAEPKDREKEVFGGLRGLMRKR
ncbi:hypothetical protein VNI00_018932 [Paramarasmius palmivorus]|uniref:Nephrocystin 3-like N-terminal domain-containing protein n=1 Tax=Paramarasmius palmivorus TaxID=297713 RepID=A0AAW0ASV0_9AGAR